MNHDTSILPGIRVIADRYKFFVVDLWGTIHDGIAPFPGALDCLAEIRRAGGKIALLSNVPARAAAVEARIAALGVAPDCYDILRTSGEETFEALTDGVTHEGLGTRYFLLGPKHYDDIGRAIPFKRVMKIDRADFVLCTALRTRSQTVEDEAKILGRAAANGLPLICVNPDLSVMRGDRTYLCAGSLARAYAEKFGGQVLWHGKPEKRAYAACLAALEAAPQETVMIGDTLHTDILGGIRAGLDTVLIAGGIHAGELGLQTRGDLDPTKLDDFLSGTDIKPNAVLPFLSW